MVKALLPPALSSSLNNICILEGHLAASSISLLLESFFIVHGMSILISLSFMNGMQAHLQCRQRRKWKRLQGKLRIAPYCIVYCRIGIILNLNNWWRYTFLHEEMWRIWSKATSCEWTLIRSCKVSPTLRGRFWVRFPSTFCQESRGYGGYMRARHLV